MDNLLLLVIGMSAVTYIPRMLPLVLLQNIQLPPFWQRFLSYIPYAAIGALIFPGILNSTASTGSAVAGGIIAVVLAYLKVNLILVVFGAILGALGWQLLF